MNDKNYHQVRNDKWYFKNKNKNWQNVYLLETNE